MKLSALAEAVQQQLHSDDAATLSFEDRLGLLVDSEWTAREQRKLQRRLQTAKLRYPASLEAVDFTQPRRLNRQQVLTARASSPVPSSSGRVAAASRPATSACRACCTRWRSGGATAPRLLARLATLDLLAIDDGGDARPGLSPGAVADVSRQLFLEPGGKFHGTNHGSRNLALLWLGRPAADTWPRPRVRRWPRRCSGPPCGRFSSFRRASPRSWTRRAR